MDRFQAMHEEQNSNAPDPIDTTVVSTAPSPNIPATTIANSTTILTSSQNADGTRSIPSQEINSSQDIVQEHWMKSFWRPTMAYLYMIICFMDFVGFPLLSMMYPIIAKSFGIILSYTAWQPLTLTNGGLIHLSFGAILGVSAWTRGNQLTAQGRNES